MAVHDANEQTAIDMAHARQKTSFDVDTVRHYLHDGPSAWKARQEIVNIVQQDPVFDKSQRPFMTRTQIYHRALAMTTRIYELKDKHNWDVGQTALATSALDEGLPIGLHMAAFEPVFQSQGSKELVEKYGKLIASRGILGCYLQTELGHGTNVARLETTATYIPDTHEFEIHSPTLTSSKWWIGSLGKTSTHGVVQAKLILPSGKDMGPHLFFVQLRSLNDHSILPGIIIGDIGPKSMAGYTGVDNGFARFDHVRIPRANMLSKFAKVTETGDYIKPPHAKLSYGGMLYIRAKMAMEGGWTVARAATVSIRYATVRRQGEIGADGLERQVITYPSTYYRLLPILSRAYVFVQLGRSLMRTFETMSKQLSTGDTSLLAEMHATTSGLKVLITTLGINDVEVARRSMGGHGFSAFSGLGRTYADYVPSATYEGDNFVLDQQVVRAAVKSFKALSSQPSLSPSTAYLRILAEKEPMPAIRSESWKDPKVLVLLLEWRAALVVREYAAHIPSSDANVQQRVSKAVAEAFVGARVGEFIQELGQIMSVKDANIVSQLYHLYLLTTVEGGLVDLLSFGVLKGFGDVTRDLRLEINQVCQQILPNAIGLTDAFGFTDWELDSALGVYDGRVYEALYKRSQDEPLNKTPVTEGYKKYIKPMLERGQKIAAKL